MRMAGEESRADRELRNTDNFYSSMSKNISDMYRGIGETGKSLNDIKQRDVISDILKDINPNFEYDPFTKKWKYKKTEDISTEKVSVNIKKRNK